MNTEIQQYNKDTAPRAIKVDMDYMADPIWVSSEELPKDDLPCVNSYLDLFPFPPALNHLLFCYREAWENAHETKYIELMNLSDEYEANPKMADAINTSLHALASACEDMLETWLKENGWRTTLQRQKRTAEV